MFGWAIRLTLEVELGERRLLPQTSVEKRIQFDSIEELLGILGEAAEIEHGLMCCYLYALWGLKTRDDDGLISTLNPCDALCPCHKQKF